MKEMIKEKMSSYPQYNIMEAYQLLGCRDFPATSSIIYNFIEEETELLILIDLGSNANKGAILQLLGSAVPFIDQEDQHYVILARKNAGDKIDVDILNDIKPKLNWDYWKASDPINQKRGQGQE